MIIPEQHNPPAPAADLNRAKDICADHALMWTMDHTVYDTDFAEACKVIQRKTDTKRAADLAFVKRVAGAS